MRLQSKQQREAKNKDYHSLPGGEGSKLLLWISNDPDLCLNPSRPWWGRGSERDYNTQDATKLHQIALIQWQVLNMKMGLDGTLMNLRSAHGETRFKKTEKHVSQNNPMWENQMKWEQSLLNVQQTTSDVHISPTSVSCPFSISIVHFFTESWKFSVKNSAASSA